MNASAALTHPPPLPPAKRAKTVEEEAVKVCDGEVAGAVVGGSLSSAVEGPLLAAALTGAAPQLAALVRGGKLWLKPTRVPELEASSALTSSTAAEAQSTAEALLPFPSLHTCFICNVVAVASVLRGGTGSRFVKQGGIPPVYFACGLNMVRDDETGEVFTVEIAIESQQELCLEEARAYPEVLVALDPEHKHDWLGFFQREYRLKAIYEVWRDGSFIRVQDTKTAHARGPDKIPTRPKGKKVDVCQCFTLHRSSWHTLDRDLLSTERGASGHAGCICIFRSLPASVEPFGMWFAYVVFADGADDADDADDADSSSSAACFSAAGVKQFSVLFFDLQNSLAAKGTRGLEEVLIKNLEWDEPPRREVFYAPFK